MLERTAERCWCGESCTELGESVQDMETQGTRQLSHLWVGYLARARSGLALCLCMCARNFEAVGGSRTAHISRVLQSVSLGAGLSMKSSCSLIARNAGIAKELHCRKRLTQKTLDSQRYPSPEAHASLFFFLRDGTPEMEWSRDPRTASQMSITTQHSQHQ